MSKGLKILYIKPNTAEGRKQITKSAGKAVSHGIEVLIARGLEAEYQQEHSAPSKERSANEEGVESKGAMRPAAGDDVPNGNDNPDTELGTDVD